MCYGEPSFGQMDFGEGSCFGVHDRDRLRPASPTRSVLASGDPLSTLLNGQSLDEEQVEARQAELERILEGRCNQIVVVAHASKGEKGFLAVSRLNKRSVAVAQWGPTPQKAVENLLIGYPIYQPVAEVK